MAAKKAKVNKAEFVRGLPDGISYKDAEEKARAAGIVLSKAYYYVLRSEAKKSAAGAEPRTSARGTQATTTRGGPVAIPLAPRSRLEAVDLTDHGNSSLMLTSANPDENALLEVTRKLGVGRVEGIIAKLKRFETA